MRRSIYAANIRHCVLGTRNRSEINYLKRYSFTVCTCRQHDDDDDLSLSTQNDWL